MEGRSEIYTSFINEGLVNEALIYIAPKMINHPDALGFIHNQFMLKSHYRIQFYFNKVNKSQFT
ncbi:MAG: hypothetical protein AB8U15_03990 [Rickettsiales endosymbiont of Dermacentor nuttalli]